MAILEKDQNQREYPRLVAGVRVCYREISLRRPEREYLKGVAENVSLGGMFIATRRSLAPGAVVSLVFETGRGNGTAPVKAKAVVCWRRRWRHPRGMGVRFIEFEGLGERRFESWVEGTLLKESPSEGWTLVQTLDAAD
ncbi:MAG TPA: PilZ domain-containing protein [Thermoanaerobaculia bacterium]|nr:PilZ domain-containing protein [Thermoanaerobaculia bacterium]